MEKGKKGANVVAGLEIQRSEEGSGIFHLSSGGMFGKRFDTSKDTIKVGDLKNCVVKPVRKTKARGTTKGYYRSDRDVWFKNLRKTI